jgi:hypothetical protein
MPFHPEVVAVLGKTFLGPPVDQEVRFVGAVVRPSRPGIGL